MSEEKEFKLIENDEEEFDEEEFEDYSIEEKLIVPSQKCLMCGSSQNVEEDLDNPGKFYCDVCWELPVPPSKTGTKEEFTQTKLETTGTCRECKTIQLIEEDIENPGTGYCETCWTKWELTQHAFCCRNCLLIMAQSFQLRFERGFRNKNKSVLIYTPRKAKQVNSEIWPFVIRYLYKRTKKKKPGPVIAFCKRCFQQVGTFQSWHRKRVVNLNSVTSIPLSQYSGPSRSFARKPSRDLGQILGTFAVRGGKYKQKNARRKNARLEKFINYI